MDAAYYISQAEEALDRAIDSAYEEDTPNRAEMLQRARDLLADASNMGPSEEDNDDQA